MRSPSSEGEFEFVAHTADIAVRLRGGTEEALFHTAAHALTEALTDRRAVLAVVSRRVELAAPELDLLLVDWLEELLFLFETEAFLVREADVTIRGRESASTDDITRAPKPTKFTKEEDEGSKGMDSSDLQLRDLRGLRDLRDEYVIRATLHGETRDPLRHPLKLLIKAVTYHGLHIREIEDGYEAMVIFDI